MAEIDSILEQLSGLETERQKYEPVLSESAKYAWPSVQDMVKVVDDPSGAKIRTVDIYDSTPSRSSRKMAVGIYSNLYSAGTRWFEFKPSDNELLEDEVVSKWMANATDTVLGELLRSKTFQNEMIARIRSKIVFGNGCIAPSLSKDKESLVFKTYHISNILFDENCDGEIDVVFRKIYYTARQARQKFPKDNLGESIERELKEKKCQSKKFEIIHGVFPREDYDPSKIDSKGKKFRSVYINRADKHLIVEENGFNEMPYIVGRFDIIPDEIMGIGIEAEMLPDIKMTGAMCKTFIESSEKQGSPPLMVEDDGVIGQPDTSSGGVIIKRSGAADPKYLQTGVNSALNAEVILQYKQDIKDGHYLNLFDVLQNYRNMTKAEVDKRSSDSLTLLSSFVGSEMNDTNLLISRVLNLLIENKKIKPLETIDGRDIDYDIVYQGRLAMAMSAVQANAVEMVIAKWAPLNDLYPVLDNLDLDKAFIASAAAQGVSTRVMRPVKERDETRKAKQDQQDAAKQLVMAESASKAYKNVTVPVQSGSLAESIVGE